MYYGILFHNYSTTNAVLNWKPNRNPKSTACSHSELHENSVVVQDYRKKFFLVTLRTGNSAFRPQHWGNLVWTLKTLLYFLNKTVKFFLVFQCGLHHFIPDIQLLGAVVTSFIHLPIRETPNEGFGEDRCDATQSSQNQSLLGRSSHIKNFQEPGTQQVFWAVCKHKE